MNRLRAFSLAVVAALPCTPALAGDGAGLDVIGFSRDGRYFAFAQEGTQDGSGFPYASIHVVDTDNNSEAQGSPVTHVDEDDANGDARVEATNKAKSLLDKLQIDASATPLAVNGMASPFEALTPMEVRPTLARETSELRFSHSAFLGETVLRLEQPLVSQEKCEGMQPGETVGAVLKLQRGVGHITTLLDDQTDPARLGCPSAYGLTAAFLDRNESRLVTILSYYPIGFEGPDRRFRAVGWKVDKP